MFRGISKKSNRAVGIPRAAAAADPLSVAPISTVTTRSVESPQSANLCLYYLFNTELTFTNDVRTSLLTYRQRFAIAIKLVHAMQALVEGEKLTSTLSQSMCLPLYGIIITKIFGVSDAAIDSVRICAMGAPDFSALPGLVGTISRESYFSAFPPASFIKTSDNSWNNKTSSQLLGQFFINLFMICPTVSGLDYPAQLAWCLENEEASACIFKRNLGHEIPDSMKENIYQLIRSMICAPEQRISLHEAAQQLENLATQSCYPTRRDRLAAIYRPDIVALIKQYEGLEPRGYITSLIDYSTVMTMELLYLIYKRVSKSDFLLIIGSLQTAHLLNLPETDLLFSKAGLEAIASGVVTLSCQLFITPLEKLEFMYSPIGMTMLQEKLFLSSDFYRSETSILSCIISEGGLKLMREGFFWKFDMVKLPVTHLYRLMTPAGYLFLNSTEIKARDLKKLTLTELEMRVANSQICETIESFDVNSMPTDDNIPTSYLRRSC